MKSARHKAQAGLELLKDAILEYLATQKEGASYSKIVTALGLESGFECSQKNYLSWSVLGLLVNEGRITYQKIAKRKTITLSKIRRAR